MNTSDNTSAVIAYIPVFGWLYVWLAARKNDLAMFHLRQSIGVLIFQVLALLVWVVFTWVLAWIPFGFLVGVVFFCVVMVAWIFGFYTWVLGVMNAWRGEMKLLPLFGKKAYTLWN